MVDPLTGIANRRSFLQDATALAQRHGSNPRPTAVLLVDLDHFKSVNDRFGHAIGDRVLEIFADAMRESIRASDLIGRLGGEEFAAILRDTSQEKAVAVADRLRECFAKAAQDVDGRPVCATISVGVVHCDGPMLDVAELLAQADQALYFAKERGRNRVELASLEMVLESRAEEHAGKATSVATLGARTAAA
jgi:diguanylate cyclase (GGDEF)-like protein